MAKAIQFHETGGPDVLRWEDVQISDPGPEEALIRHTAIGLNFIDCYFRDGTYPSPQLPVIPGFEAAGVVEAVGGAVNEVAVGDRVVYGTAPIGAYCESRLIPADKLVPIPDDIDDTRAAAMLLQGMTAHYLLHRTFQVQSGQTVLFHAAAGGVGLIASQWAKHLGVKVIGTVSSPEKAEIASSHGCEHAIIYGKDTFVDRVKEITNGAGVPVVYDSVGKETFYESLDCLSPLGTMVLFGYASGPVTPFDINLLASKGSLFLTRPSLFNYVATRSDLLETANALFNVVRCGAIKIEIHQTYPLDKAAQAHRDLQSRRTTGSTVLIP